MNFMKHKVSVKWTSIKNIVICVSKMNKRSYGFGTRAQTNVYFDDRLTLLLTYQT